VRCSQPSQDNRSAMETRKYSPNPQIEVCLSQWRYFSKYLCLVQIWDAPYTDYWLPLKDNSITQPPTSRRIVMCFHSWVRAIETVLASTANARKRSNNPVEKMKKISIYTEIYFFVTIDDHNFATTGNTKQ